MNKIKIRCKRETIIGEILIIFCTIFYTVAQNGADFANLINMKYTGPTDFILEMDKIKMDKIAASGTRKWYFPLQDDDKKFSLIVSSNHSNIRWFLYYRNERDTGPLNSSYGNILFNYSLNKQIGYFSDDSRMGLYGVEINVIDDAWVSLYLSKKDYEVAISLINIVDKMQKPRQIRTKFDLRNNTCIIEWPQILEKYNVPGLNLFIVVSSEKYYKFLPYTDTKDDNNVFRDQDDSKIFFLYRNVTSSKSTVINNLKPDEIYFITILAANSANVSVIYARTSFKFQKMKPLGLKDGKLVQKSLKRNGGRLSYKYKVSRQRFQNFSGPLIWYVSRCSGKMLVKIKHKKKLIQEKLVTKYEFFVIEKLEPNNRYVMKITDASRDQNLDFDDVEVLATMRPHLYPILQRPKSLKVNLFSNESKSTISWLPVASNDAIQYCIYTKEIELTEFTASSLKNMVIANQCRFNEVKDSYNLTNCNFKLYNSTSGNRNLLKSIKVRNHNQDLAVQITAEKMRNKITIIYDLLVISNRNAN